MQNVTIFTDGACSGNPGKGGWAALLRCATIEKTIYGNDQHTTNNRMELIAVIQGLLALKRSCKVLVVTDSQYVCKNAENFLDTWIKNNWKNSSGKSILNVDLWQELYILLQKHVVSWQWVKGHKGHKENEIVDTLARKAINLPIVEEYKLKKDTPPLLDFLA